MTRPDDHPTALARDAAAGGGFSGVPAFGEHAGDMLGPYLICWRCSARAGSGWSGWRSGAASSINALRSRSSSREWTRARGDRETRAGAPGGGDDGPPERRACTTRARRRGRPYFVMEHVAGEPITDYCDKQRLTIRRRLELFIHVCEAVQHAHQKGIIHRDLKPSGILVGSRVGSPRRG